MALSTKTAELSSMPPNKDYETLDTGTMGGLGTTPETPHCLK